jgi:hypothetical protein
LIPFFDCKLSSAVEVFLSEFGEGLQCLAVLFPGLDVELSPVCKLFFSPYLEVISLFAVVTECVELALLPLCFTPLLVLDEVVLLMLEGLQAVRKFLTHFWLLASPGVKFFFLLICPLLEGHAKVLVHFFLLCVKLLVQSLVKPLLEVKLHVLLPITFLFCLKLANKPPIIVILPVLVDQRVSLFELFLSEGCECQDSFVLCSVVLE